MSREPLPACLLVWLALALVPFLAPGWVLSELSPYLAYGLLAMSLALVWGQAGILSFGQAIFFGAGAYAFAVVGTAGNAWLGLAASLLVPPAIAAALGAILFAGRGASGAPLAVITLALSVLAERLATRSGWLGGSNGLIGIPPLSIGGFELIDPLPLYLCALAGAFLAWAALAAVVGSGTGACWRAVRENPLRAAHLGIDPAHRKVAAFTLAAAVAGLGGGLFAAQLGFVSPPLLGAALSTEALLWVALGGRGLLITGLLGALLVRLVESRLAEELGSLWLMAMGLLVVLVTLLLPQGILGYLLALPAKLGLSRSRNP